jgi:hypothetical protein
MCINIQTSIFAFFTGMISGYLLVNKTIEYNLVGKFIMFYSFVQLFEALIYYYGENASPLFSKLILINLGLQGLIWFLLIGQVIVIDNIYYYIMFIISAYIIYYTLTNKNFQKAKIDNCIEWTFLVSENIKLLLIIMYALIFYKGFNNYNNLIKIFSLIYIITLLLALNNNNYPSIWCLYSALVAPLFLLIWKFNNWK